MVRNKKTGKFTGSKYLKINGVWYRSQCVVCKKWLQGHNVSKCHNCFWSDKLNPVVINGNRIPHYHKAHWWIKKKSGTPCKCEMCGLTDINSRRFHWANISEKYKLDTSDWIRLCASCHKSYDLGRLEGK